MLFRSGWNIGPAAYGYLADRVPHPVPVKASQGRTKTRLALDPVWARVVEQIFTWRVVHKLGMPTIAAKLNAAAGPSWPQRCDTVAANTATTSHRCGQP